MAASSAWTPSPPSSAAAAATNDAGSEDDTGSGIDDAGIAAAVIATESAR